MPTNTAANFLGMCRHIAAALPPSQPACFFLPVCSCPFEPLSLEILNHDPTHLSQLPLQPHRSLLGILQLHSRSCSRTVCTLVQPLNLPEVVRVGE